MNYKKENLNNLINHWFEFRENEISTLSKEDKKHLIYFDELSNKILKNVSTNNQKYVENILKKIDENFTDYITYWDRKYYVNGFKDAISILLLGLGDKIDF